TTSRSANLRCRELSLGIPAQHGPHQVAQKSISTILPRMLGCGVIQVSTTRSGAWRLMNDLANSFLLGTGACGSSPTGARLEAGRTGVAVAVCPCGWLGS